MSIITTLRRVLREIRKEQKNEKAKSLILKSDICQQFVEDLFEIADTHPNTMVVIKPLTGGEIIIKSRLTDSTIYDSSEFYRIPDITNTIAIAGGR